MRVSGFTLTDYVRKATIRNALQIYALQERIEGYNKKWHNRTLIMEPSRLSQKVEN
jgi:hypothetical protein